VIIYHGLELLKGSFTRLNGKFESGLTNVTAAFPSHATTSANTTFENDGDWEKISPIKPTLTLRDAIEEVNKNTVEERERARSASTELSGLDEQPPATLGVQSLVIVIRTDNIKVTDMSGQFVPEQSPSLQARTRKRDRSRDRSRGHPRRSRSPRSPLESSYHQQTSRRSSRKYAPYGGPDNSPDLNRESSRGRSVSPARVSYRERRRFREPRNPRKHGILPARMSPRDSRSPRRNSRSLRRERSRPRGDNSLRPRKSY
jgi:hypothetical protein